MPACAMRRNSSTSNRRFVSGKGISPLELCGVRPTVANGSRIQWRWNDFGRFLAGFDHACPEAFEQVRRDLPGLAPAGEVDELMRIGQQVIELVLDVRR